MKLLTGESLAMDSTMLKAKATSPSSLRHRFPRSNPIGALRVSIRRMQNSKGAQKTP